MEVPTAIGTDAHERWELEEGAEIALGRTALKRLGGGHRYDAYLAWDEARHTIVVCKLVRPHLTADQHTLAGLAGEWEMLERLRHPVIVRGFDAVLEGPRPHIALEHLEGPRLSTLVRRYGPLPVEQLVPLALQLSAAIHYLRGQRVVHLDLKPSNTIMGAPPRLIDLSVALTADEATTLTRPVGTDAYMAPEQCAPVALGPVTAAADVWGLGITLYKAATGELPFGKAATGELPVGKAEAQGDGGASRWPQLVREPDWPTRIIEPVAMQIMACLHREPEARPTPAEVHERLESVVELLPKPQLSRFKPRL